KEVEKRSPDLPEEVKQDVAERIGISAIRYTMLSVEPVKGVNFVWDRVLNFEMNSAPFINYAYTRGLGILRKLGRVEKPKGHDKLTEPADEALILHLSKLPGIFASAADNLDPTVLTGYATELAQRFHEFYEKSDISHLADEELKQQRTALVMAVRDVLRNLADVLGLKLAERM
ncbi:MAG TPA: DALR anticodon-binding domain-containing protein, partial [Candidatus Binatus sp.]|nr:DALR anticodon-binding domain-containing protein [Candidatus Binatus sp.]